MERARLQNSFIYDVTLKGAGPEKIAEWLAENGVAPKPSSVRVHNEKEEWQAVSPDLKGGESGAQGIAKMMRGLLLGGVGIPSHWFAQGEDVNRASAESMDQPTLKKMTRRQRTVRHILQAMADKQLEEAHRAGALPRRSAPLRRIARSAGYLRPRHREDVRSAFARQHRARDGHLTRLDERRCRRQAHHPPRGPVRYEYGGVGGGEERGPRAFSRPEFYLCLHIRKFKRGVTRLALLTLSLPVRQLTGDA